MQPLRTGASCQTWIIPLPEAPVYTKHKFLPRNTPGNNREMKDSEQKCAGKHGMQTDPSRREPRSRSLNPKIIRLKHTHCPLLASLPAIWWHSRAVPILGTCTALGLAKTSVPLLVWHREGHNGPKPCSLQLSGMLKTATNSKSAGFACQRSEQADDFKHPCLLCLN